MIEHQKNLLLIPDVDHHRMEDFLLIADLIRQQAPDIRPIVMRWDDWRRHNLQKWRMSLRPTLVVGMRSFGRRLSPWRGACHQGQNLSKSDTYALMQAGGLPVIPWCHWTASTDVSSMQMGDFVISKPDIGARGRAVKIRSVAKLAFDSEKHAKEPLILQRFVYTGPFPVVHRVLTLYGVPLMHCRSMYRQGKACTDPNDRRELAGHNPVASHHGAEITLVNDKDIEELATSVAKRAFADIPLLGFDIIRSALDGSLHVCEVNAYGQTWHFSSDLGMAVQRDNGVDFAGQKNAFETAASVLIQACREHAR